MADEMSPVEQLQTAATAARGVTRPQGGQWRLGELGDAIGDLLEREARLIEITGRDFVPDVRDACVREFAETYHADSLLVAWVLLGLPDGH